MSVSAEPSSAAARRAASAALVAHLEASGYPRYEPPVLQRAELFFNSGEEIRSRLYLTSDLSGAEYCLRPEYTIPVCAHYLASEAVGRATTYSYCGPVFRYRPDGLNEFLQAGLENFGHPDREARRRRDLGRDTRCRRRARPRRSQCTFRRQWTGPRSRRRARLVAAMAAPHSARPRARQIAGYNPRSSR